MYFLPRISGNLLPTGQVGPFGKITPPVGVDALHADNVLINVQLELRVPLFFSAWIKKTYNPGVLETRMPYLDMLIQPELPSLEELEAMQRDTRHRRPGRWTEFLVYVNTLLSTVAGIQTEEPNLSSKLLKSKNISYIPKAISVLYKLRLNQESKITPVRMTVRELMQKTQQSISFPRYLGAIMAANRSGVIPRDLAVWVADVEYYERLGNLLYHTSFNELQEYITFCILHKYAPYVYRPLAILKRKLLEPLAGTEHSTADALLGSDTLIINLNNLSNFAARICTHFTPAKCNNLLRDWMGFNPNPMFADRPIDEWQTRSTRAATRTQASKLSPSESSYPVPKLTEHVSTSNAWLRFPPSPIPQ
ncbi:hypothetical protein T265_00460 [Opisthorchis viverrini]|uniref:Peptidase M13 N-terminal domain-containing protein n=1 Tax=Opisthorchis viverrini TaxID=6198 RepID=A0A075A643_OPIVI|nr:hypothetical protein T265_00460 [Opisthorchis viverrini]KER33792.1 hypothetical protein T265_00460 [Opisthorchis viverrini]